MDGAQKRADLGPNFRRMSLQGEMSCIKEDDFSGGIISTKSLGTGWQEERIILSPHGKGRRSVGAEVLLKLWVKRDVSLIVDDQIELNLRTLWSVQECLVQRDGFRGNPLVGILDARRVLPPRRLRRGQELQGIAVFAGGILPIRADGSPAFAESIDVGVSILRDKGSDPIGMLESEAKAGRRAVVEDVDGELFQADLLGELTHDLGQMIEGVGEALVIRRVGKAEAGQVGRDNVKIVREFRDQVAEHVARRGKAMKEKHCRCLKIARLTVEDFDTAHIRRVK